MKESKGFDLRFNPIEMAKILREKMIDLKNKRVLLADFTKIKQKRNDKAVQYIEGKHFRAKMYTTPRRRKNPSSVQPAEVASRKLGVPKKECNEVFLFQVKGCNLGVCLSRGVGCWFCYVNNNHLIPNRIGGEYLAAREILLNYLAVSRKRFYTLPDNRINVLRLSGGELTIVPEIIIWLIDEIKRINFQDHIYLWVDTNLLTGNLFWEALGKSGIKKIREFPNIGFCGCYKGFDEESFRDNLKIDPKFFKEQFIMHKKLIDNGFDDVYSYVDSTCFSTHDLEKRMDSFVVRLKEVDWRAPLRLTVLEIKDYYATTKERMGPQEIKAVEYQWQVIEAWKKALKRHFTSAELALDSRAFPKRMEK